MISIPGYKDYEEIGKGGMATVYRAIQESTDRHVAIKVMSTSLTSDNSFTERFLKEARMAYLSHPNIITVHDSGKIDDTHYIVMEYAGGGSFDKQIKMGVTPVEVLRVILQVANALEYAGKHDVVHRDVKPDNILLKNDNTALLVDFGIAKAITSGDKLTMVGMAVGSSHYMSPEQARGFEIDIRSDLYSLGVVLYEALMGQTPYNASDTFAIAIQHINDPIPVLSKGLEKFQPIINKLLAKDPDDRYQTATELIYVLESLFDEMQGVDVSDAAKKLAIAATTAKENKSRLPKTVVSPDAVTALNINVEGENVDDATVIKPIPDALQLKHSTLDQGVKKSSSSLIVILAVVTLVAVGAVYFLLGADNKNEATISPVIAKPGIVKPKIINKVVVEPVQIIEPVEKPPIVEVDNTAELIVGLLAKANEQFKKNRLTSPKNNNAYSTYQQVLEIEADNADAMNGIEAIVEKYYQLSVKQQKKSRTKKALQYVEKGLRINGKSEELLQWREELLALPQLPKIKKAYFKKNLSAFRRSTLHKSIDRNQGKKFAKLSLINRIYANLSEDCYRNSARFSSNKCTNLFKRSFEQWPIPVSFAKFQSQNKDGYIQSKYVTSGVSSIRRLKIKMASHIRVLKDKDASYEQQTTAYANLLLYEPVASMAGLPVYNISDNTIEKRLTKESRNQRSIKSISKLLKTIQNEFDTEEMVIRSVTSDSSLEITPYAAALYRAIKKRFIPAGEQSSTLYARYRLLKSGDVEIDFWQFDRKNEIIALKRFTLTRTLFSQFRRNNLVFTEELLPDDLYKKGEYLSSEIALSGVSSHRLLTIGEKVKLQIKMDKPGFYYIVMHVSTDDGFFSYLLPLRRSEKPFVKTVNKDQLSRFVSLGELKITPPAGVEIMQLITSNINLENYLPENEWSKKQKKYILENTDNDISNGLNIVRAAVSEISKLNAAQTPYWQERLLVTSIVP